MAPAVSLTWSASSGATSYQVYRNGSFYAAGISGTSFDNNANVIAGQTYSYFIRAINANGTTDSNSISVSVPVNVCAGSQPPGNFTVSGSSYCNTTPPAAPAVSLAWSASTGATSYQVYRNGSFYAGGITGTSFDNNANVVAGQTYSYFIRAVNTNGTTDSNSISVTVPVNICAGSQPPGNLTVSGNAYCNTTLPVAPAVSMTWSASTGTASYQVYRNGSFYAGGITGTSFDNNVNVVAGQTYSYFIRAVNANGTTDSNSISVTVPVNICAGSQPPGNLTVSGNAYCNTTPQVAPAVSLAWSASTGATSYQVYRNGSFYATGITGTSFDNNANVVAGQTYSYFIRAVNANGTTDSNSISVTVPVNVCAGSQPPGSFTVSGSAFCNTTPPVVPAVSLTWNVSTGATSYQVYRNGFFFTGGITGASFVDNDNLVAGLTYSYFVRAVNANGTTDSNTISVTVPLYICAGSQPPGNLTVSGSAYCNTTPPVAPAVSLTWSASTGATSYQVYRNDSVHADNIVGAAYEDKLDVIAGQVYSYFIRARNASGTTDSNVTEVSIPLSTCPGAASIELVVLGDSYSSGEGTFFYDTDWLDFRNGFVNRCHRASSRTWSGSTPGGQKKITVPGLDSVSVDRHLFACSGATLSHLYSPRYFSSTKEEPPQLEHVDELMSADIIGLTMGGNDVLFSKLLRECFWNEDCTDYTPEEDSTTLKSQRDIALSLLASQLPEAYRDIKGSGNVPVFVLGYPIIIPENFSDRILCSLEDNFDAGEREFLRETGESLNKVIECAAAEAGVHFVPIAGDVEPVKHRFPGHEVCGEEADWIWGIDADIGRDVPERFHPKNRGYEAMAAIAAHYIQTVGDGLIPHNPPPSVPADCPTSKATASQVVYEVGSLSVVAQNSSCDSLGRFVSGQMIEVQGGGFEALASVIIRLETDGYSELIGSTSADTDGKLMWSGAIPFAAPNEGAGFIKATGASSHGGRLSLYKDIEMAPSVLADEDGDGVPDICDNCPSVWNSSQVDLDFDRAGDACDMCPLDGEDDFDADGLCANVDPCPFDPLNDEDGDGLCGDVDELNGPALIFADGFESGGLGAWSRTIQ